MILTRNVLKRSVFNTMFCLDECQLGSHVHLSQTCFRKERRKKMMRMKMLMKIMYPPPYVKQLYRLCAARSSPCTVNHNYCNINLPLLLSCMPFCSYCYIFREVRNPPIVSNSDLEHSLEV